MLKTNAKSYLSRCSKALPFIAFNRDNITDEIVIKKSDLTIELSNILNFLSHEEYISITLHNLPNDDIYCSFSITSIGYKFISS